MNIETAISKIGLPALIKGWKALIKLLTKKQKEEILSKVFQDILTETPNINADEVILDALEKSGVISAVKIKIVRQALEKVKAYKPAPIIKKKKVAAKKKPARRKTARKVAAKRVPSTRKATTKKVARKKTAKRTVQKKARTAKKR